MSNYIYFYQLAQNTIFISGGHIGTKQLTTLEAFGHSDTILPPLPEANSSHNMVITNSKKFLILGGNHDDRKQCYKFENGVWQKQNPLTQPRSYATCVVMPNGIYCFGGTNSPCTSDFLPNGQTEWQAGPAVPEPGISRGDGVAISPKELLLVGGSKTLERILRFNIETQEWSEVGSLFQGRCDHRCFFYNGNVLVTGGVDGGRYQLKSTEMIEVSDWRSKRVGDLNKERYRHGIGVVDISGKSKLVVFGGGWKRYSW